MRKQDELIIIIILICSMVPALLIFEKIGIQVDLTDRNIYSIEDSTREILNQFDQPLYITWWKSDEFDSPQLNLLKDLLRLFPRSTDFNLDVSVKNPTENDKIRLRELGLQENQIETSIKGEIKQILIFSGLEISYLNHRVTVPFVAEPEKLEFQVVEALNRIIDGGLKNLAIYSDSTTDNPDGLYTLLTAELSNYFNVLSISESNPLTIIPDAIIVTSRADYTLEELYAIDRSIQAGVPVIFLMDGLKIDPQSNDYALQRDEKHILSRWLESYGVIIGDAVISDKNSLLLNYYSGVSGRYSHYDLWFKGNEKFDLLWASPMTVKEIRDIRAETFVESSQMSWLNEGETDLRPEFSQNTAEFTGPYPVVVELKGIFPPLFQNSSNDENIEGTILVISSSLSFSDLMQTSGSTKNILYLQNMIYRLLGKKELYQVAENSYVTPLMDRETLLTGVGQFRVKVINLFVMPFLIVCLYFILISFRKKHRNGK